MPQAQAVQEAPPLTGVGSVQPTVSTYVQNSFPIKHFQVNGDVSLFAQKVARVNGSLLNLEIEGAIRSMGWLEEILHIYGNSQATALTQRPQWDGLRTQIGAANKIDAVQLNVNGLLNLPMLDAAMDAIRIPYANNLQGQGFFFLLSPKMQSKLVQLTQTETRVLLEKTLFKPMDDGGVMGAPIKINNVDPGVEVYSYRGIPIILTSFLSAPGQMGAVTLSQAAGTTPFLGAAVRYYQVTAITVFGETLTSAEVSITIGTTANSVTLSWSTPSIIDPISNAAVPLLAYGIFEAATTGKETLLAVVPAFDQNDAAVTSWTDLGAASTVGSSVFYQVGANGDGVTYPNQFTTGNPNGYGSENIYLVCRDPNLVVVPTVNDLTPQLLALVNARSRQFAITADECLAMRAPLFASAIERVRFA